MPLTRPKVKPPAPWEGFLVLNGDKIVLGVYGSAIRNMAEEQCDKLRKQFPSLVVDLKSHTSQVRPRVGDKLP